MAVSFHVSHLMRHFSGFTQKNEYDSGTIEPEGPPKAILKLEHAPFRHDGNG